MMEIVRSLPHRVRVIENTFIRMNDGTRLAARIWLPVDAEQQPVPAIMEYLPYRKRDLTRERDAMNHAYLAGHGYACVRVDIRGSGDSGGVITDEYTRQEQDDALETIAWIAEQPWCDGNVGMMGISWGGFNSLQVAARQPPALKAIITVCSSDDLYADNMHYMGGCLLGDNFSEAAVMFALNSLPPDPGIVGERWREMWFDRLEGSGLWLETWLTNQHRNDYWKRASVCENYGAIRCPVLAIGGWADGFTNAIFQLLHHLDVPRQGLIGPWGHKYPHYGTPGPAIGFLQEAVRWWDHWLKGRYSAIMDEPMLRAWMQDSIPPRPSYETRPGRWVGEPVWPSPHIEVKRLPLGPGYIAADEKATVDARELHIQSPLSVGMFAGKWCSYATSPDLPGDQREEDGGALVFDSDSLVEPLEILGMPIVDLELSANKAVGMIAARLSDVAPGGKATRVSYGLLNLTHRNSDQDPQPLKPGRRYSVRLRLNGIAQRFSQGHRLRLSISTSYWPLAWTPPEPVTVTLVTGNNASALHLPIRPLREEAEGVAPFAEPQGAPPLETRQLAPGEYNRRVVRNMAKAESTLEVITDRGCYRIEATGTEIRDRTLEQYTVEDDDFASARGEIHTKNGLKRGDWEIETTTRMLLTCTSTHFHIHAQLDAYEGRYRVYSRNWRRTIPRDHL